ncbi:hypothetical protein QE410_003353 [Microbacterium sp. SORGH_AS 1204]|nr:hypothetical protein [Microbacterium sp. SORGH_AS_1204]
MLSTSARLLSTYEMSGDGAPGWPANWSSLVPDLIVATVTGLALGLALWLFQRSVERRSQQVLATRTSRRLVQPLLLVIQRPTYVPNYQDLGLLSRKNRAALELLERSELDSWHETQPTELTNALVTCRARLRDFERDAQDVRDAVERWFRLHSAPPGVREVVTARILGAELHELEAVAGGRKNLASIQPDVAVVLGSRLVKRHFRAYRAAEGRTERSIAALLDILILEIRRRSTGRSTAGENTSRRDSKRKAIISFLTEPL